MNRHKIARVLAEIAETEPEKILTLPDETPIADLELGSLDFLNFIVKFESEFGVEVRDSDIYFPNFQTLGKIYDTLEKYFEGGAVKKVLVCDCDDVLWDGVSGEESIKTDALRTSLQKTLSELSENGILVCLCSRNTRENIDSALKGISAILSESRIAIISAEAENKAEGLRNISKELGLSTDSFVFIDNSDYEIGCVSAILPEVECVKFDPSDNHFCELIKGWFNMDSAEGIDRVKLYREQKEREKSKSNFDTVEQYNKSLETVFTCGKAKEEEAARIAELSMRTNQFNLSAARYSAEKILSFISQEDYTVISLSVSDKYGDMGLVGAAVASRGVEVDTIEAFFLSCRVFGRGFELVLLDEVKRNCSSPLNGTCIPTDKNKRFRNFYSDNGVISIERK